MVDRSLIDEVKQKNPIDEIVSMYVHLKKRGNAWLGLCPFHPEKTPSFQVSPEKGFFYCFGCQTGGDVFKFLELKENLSFSEALASLAERAGISLERAHDPAQRRQRAERDEVRRAIEQAAAFFAARLAGPEGAAARQYLAQRGVSGEAIERFGLGWAPDGWDNLLNHLLRQGFQLELLLRAGLVVRTAPDRAARSRSGAYDRFRARIMFPICDIRGRPVGFGGRTMDDRQPKYLNSPETPYFSKGTLLYGLHLAKDAIRSAGEALVVEGYMDAIACHQAGVRNAVASMGTALTEAQGRLLLQQAERVVIGYDADAAGKNATLRGMQILAGLGCRVHVLRLDEGKDPDEFIAARGPEAFAAALRDAAPLLEYRLDLARQGVDLSKPDGKALVARRMVSVLAETVDAVERGEYLRQVARRLGLREAELEAEVRRYLRGGGQGMTPGGLSSRTAGDKAGKRWHPNTGSPRAAEPGREKLLGPLPVRLKAERDLVALMLQDAGVIDTVRAEIPLDWFSEPRLRRIAELLLQGRWPPEENDQETPVAPPAAGGERPVRPPQPGEPDLSPGHLVNLAAAIALALPPAGEAATGAEGDAAMRVAAHCIRILREHTMVQRLSELRRQIQQFEQSGRAIPMDLLKEYQELARKSKGP